MPLKATFSVPWDVSNSLPLLCKPTAFHFCSGLQIWKETQNNIQKIMSIFLGIFCHFCRWSFRCGSSPMIKKRTVVVRGKRYHLSTLFCTTSLSVFLDAGRTTTARNYCCDILLPLLSSFPKSSFFRCCASLPYLSQRKKLVGVGSVGQMECLFQGLSGFSEQRGEASICFSQL